MNICISFKVKRTFYDKGYYKDTPGTSLAIQWLGLHASNVEDTGSIPGWGTKIPHTMWPKKKKKPFILSLVCNQLRDRPRSQRDDEHFP